MKTTIIFIILSSMCQKQMSNVYDFKNAKNIAKWNVVDDQVMGGLSQGKMILNEHDNGLFKGYVTTENNGGFSSVRYAFGKKDVSKFEHVVLKVRGDCKTYQFRIKSDASQRYSYIQKFNTSGNWQSIKLPFDSFYPAFRGRILDRPNYKGEAMEEIAFLIGNNRNEDFSLEIEKIYLE